MEERKDGGSGNRDRLYLYAGGDSREIGRDVSSVEKTGSVVMLMRSRRVGFAQQAIGEPTLPELSPNLPLHSPLPTHHSLAVTQLIASQQCSRSFLDRSCSAAMRLSRRISTPHGCSRGRAVASSTRTLTTTTERVQRRRMRMLQSVCIPWGYLHRSMYAPATMLSLPAPAV